MQENCGDVEREQRKKQWDQWNKQREVEKNLESIGVDINEAQSRNNYLADLTYKIAEKSLAQQPKLTQKQQQLEQKVCKEVEGNTCAICFELMVPPNYSPILLFPCGHTFCRFCTLQDTKLKIQKCPLCRTKIQSHAVNLSLQNLICAFTNQKHLIDNQENENLKNNSNQEETQNFGDLYKMYKMRCEILLEERQNIEKIYTNANLQLEKQYSVVETLQIQRENIKQKMAKLEKELAQVNQVLEQTLENVDQLNEKSRDCEQKKVILDETLKPLQQEMQKYRILSQKQ